MPFSSKKDSERERTIMENRFNSITLSTGNVNKKYILRDIIFATDLVEIDLFSEETNPNEVFQNVCKKLKQMALNMKLMRSSTAISKKNSSKKMKKNMLKFSLTEQLFNSHKQRSVNLSLQSSLWH